MDNKQSIELIIEDHAGPLSILEFIQFLTEFRAVYLLALGAVSNHTVDAESAAVNGKIIADYLQSMSPDFLSLSMNGAAGSLQGTELYFLDIQRVNPVKITLKGSITALVAVVFILGGKVEADPKTGILIAWAPGLAQSVINIANAFGLANGTVSNSSDAKPLPASTTSGENNQIGGSNVSPSAGRTMSKNSSRQK